jgi:heme/copper-type cytochrome/quinol oxidase subunit 3
VGDAAGTPEEQAFEARAAEGAIWTGTRLAIGIGLFFLASLAFAYFYLRSYDNYDLWRPGGITAPTAPGAAVMAFVLAAGGLVWLSVRRMRQGNRVDWQVAGWIAVLSGLVALGLQIWEMTDVGFSPGSSGYASCFIGWGVSNIVMILAGVYWIETLLARAARLRGSDEPPSALTRANAEGALAFWAFIAAAELLFWVLFYVI